MANERATYVTYNRGLEAKHLHLGNLVHDYRNPNALEPYVEKAYTDVSEPAPEWARSTALPNYALTLGKGSTEDDDAEEDEIPGTMDGSGASPRYRVVAAAKTVRAEIKDPKKFFDEVTLKSNEAKKWLSARFSAAESLAASRKDAQARPQLWMLTGLILMSHATWSSISSDAHSFTAGLPAPFDPTGVSAIRKLSVSDGVRPTVGYTPNEEGKHVSGAVIHETGKYPGTRGWAAQWQKVDVQILPAEKMQAGVNNQLPLTSTEANSRKIAVVKLQDGAYAENEARKDEAAQDFDDDYWEALIDASEDASEEY